MRVTRYLAYAAAALSFAYVARAHIFGIPTTLLEVLLVATLVAYIIEKRVSGERFPNALRLPYFGPVVVLLVAATISIAVAPDHRGAAGIWKAYFIEPALVAYVLIDVLRTRRQLQEMVSAFFVSGTVVAVLNLVKFGLAVKAHQPNLIEVPPVAIYNSANATALFLGPLLALALALLLFGEDGERRVSAAFLVIGGAAFITSFSRGGWVGLIIAAAFLAWHHRRRLQLYAAGGGAAVIALVIPPIRHRIAHEFNPSDPYNSVNTRKDLWGATFRMLKQGTHSILGSGLSGFKQAITPFKDVSGYHEDLIYPHDVFLNFWTETGLLGLIAFLWLAFEGVRHSSAALRGRTPLRAYHLAWIAAGITILVHGLLDVPFFKNDLALLTFSLLALQVATLRQETRR